MKVLDQLRFAAAAVACVGMLSPAATFGATPDSRAASARGGATIQDVALDADDTLAGQLVDPQGQAISRAAVVIQQGDHGRQLVTDEEGRFAVAGLRGGVYQVQTATTSGTYRCWTHSAAPPTATRSILLVDQQASLLRGQCADGACSQPVPGYAGNCSGQVCGQGGYYGGAPQGGLLRVLSNPWVIGSAVALAIALPLALDDDDAS